MPEGWVGGWNNGRPTVTWGYEPEPEDGEDAEVEEDTEE